MGRADLPHPPYRELGEKLKEFREFQRFRQEDLAQALAVHINTLANFERGTHRPLFEFLIRFGNALRLDEDEWKELREIYELVIRQEVAPDSIARVKHLSLVLNDERDRIERPHSLKPFYDHQQSWQPSEQIQSRLLKRLFAFRSLHPIPVITGIFGQPVGGAPVLSASDNRGAALLEEMLESLKIRRRHLESVGDELPPLDQSSMVLSGGPARNRMTDAVNQKFSTEPWFSGFFFSNENPHDEWGWVMRHRTHEDVAIANADISDSVDERADAPPRDPALRDRYRYRRLPDGQELDYGLLYLGPHPHNFQHWLVMVAGLRGMGTFAAAKALSNPAIAELIAQQLLLKRHYISGLVRYRFRDIDQERFRGCVSSICLTTGMVPES
jgi:transcriptional regulator with XRE-family HTH domain